MTIRKRASGAIIKNSIGQMVKECADTDPPPDARSPCDGCCYGSNTTVTATISMFDCRYNAVNCADGLLGGSASAFHVVGIINSQAAATYIQVFPSASDYNVWVSSDGAGAAKRLRTQIGISALSMVPPDLTCPITNARPSVHDKDMFVFLLHSCSGGWFVGFNGDDSTGPIANQGAGSPVDGNPPCQRAATFWCSQWNQLGSSCLDQFGTNHCAPSTDTCCRFIQSHNACRGSGHYGRFHDITVNSNNGCLCSGGVNCINTSDQTNVACTEPATTCNAAQGTDCPP